MHAERLMLETDTTGSVKRMPRLPPNKHLEAIFLVMDPPAILNGARRCPHVDIVGKVELRGDVLSSAPESDWNLPA